MGSVNSVFLVGHLGKDAVLRTTPGGATVASFSIATSEQWRDKKCGEKKELTEWSNVVWWGEGAKAIASYLTKGKLVAVQGKLQTRAWEKDGVKRYSTEIKADRVVLLGGKNDGNGNSDRREPTSRQAVSADHELPDDGHPSGANGPQDDCPF
jgi:single-strand DNA-binding protein